jgi:hypothetical protein
MTHKGGKRAKKSFHKLHLSKAMKERIEDLPHHQLAVLLTFIRALMAASAGRAHGAKKARSSKSHRKLSKGIHRVRIGKHMRKVNVLANGRWRFMKG